MAELATLARPYARAAFEYALNEDALQSWSEALQTAAAICDDNRVKALVGDPSRTSVAKADAFIALLGSDKPQPLNNFIRLLADYNRLPLLAQIYQTFLVMKANQEQSVDLEVTSAFDIDAEQADRLAQVMGEKLKRRVKIQTAIDNSLIGGAILRAGDLVIDGTVRGRLTKLAAAMDT